MYHRGAISGMVGWDGSLGGVKYRAPYAAKNSLVTRKSPLWLFSLFIGHFAAQDQHYTPLPAGKIGDFFGVLAYR